MLSFTRVSRAQFTTAITRPTNITAAERAALRAARRERGRQLLQQQEQSTTQQVETTKWHNRVAGSRWLWYVGLLVPTAIITWAVQDEDSPPARLAEAMGLAGWIRNKFEEMAVPQYDKLLPDWSQMPNVPHDIPVPHTLVIDLDNTLVSSTWDRKYGYRHAKRPGVDQFLRTMAMYYEIVLFSPSIDGMADPVVTSLDKEGCIMHRLYRDATVYKNGVYIKDLDRLNRNVNRIVVLDDDPEEVQFHPYNVIPIKPYTDPSDRTDNALERITPFLIEIARENYGDIPTLLRQYHGMDSDQIADEIERRINLIRYDRLQQSSRGLGGLAPRNQLPAPELPAEAVSSTTVTRPVQLTAKDIAGKAPDEVESNGLVGWMQRRAKEKEEHQMRKMEKWQQVMMDRQKRKSQEA
ncbi:hypothetical protein FisN_3Hh365 [Fistulifera solaris]|uniref:Mitochondrial import inner membrane translocase subunit TIM50 n=1 Tax=Fistulifera solaris TaxID=1519565 RepID=A0A1Z5JQ73_FISSO|nr:hypothetical protein FisN_3Hh365 [Fistulifera solaris]|eukprot:GAX16154.1 hypothetical protein FisN_3Hh365 [Fistulifera solaris]